MKLLIKRLTPTACLPARGSLQASCFDLRADQPGMLQPGQRMLVKTGIAVEVPPGFEVQLRPRSGLALKQGVSIVNTPATVDSDYRGEVGVILINHGQEPFAFSAGDRIAQMGVYPVELCEAQEVEDLSESKRGAGGYGHTGIK
ncbi:MAG: dUTP diphosphatase [Opitutaceae bacterium]|nr:dUTP diphosphatase [Opitutaceae bacterium]